MSKKNLSIGICGEKAVKKYLRRRFYKIIECNYKCFWGEIDIVAKRGKYICFIEVKTRGKNAFGRPADAVTNLKQEKIIKSAYSFLHKYECNSMARFDIAEVFADNGKFKIVYIKNAFDLNENNFHL